MTRRALPKPVEAWAVYQAGRLQWSGAWSGSPGYTIQPMAVHKLRRTAIREACDGDFVIRVRIVPITPKSRTKRKEKKK